MNLRPEDAMSRPLQSTGSQTNNVLLKVTVPRWTGRRRKRGTEEPFKEAHHPSEDDVCPRRSARDLRRSLEDNVGRYRAEPVGMVNRTHVFRGIHLYISTRLNIYLLDRNAGFRVVDIVQRIYQSVP